MPRRSFVVFDNLDRSATECLKLLGRVVLDPCRPLDGYRPKKERQSQSASARASTSTRNDGNQASNQTTEDTTLPNEADQQSESSATDDTETFLSDFRLKAVKDTKTIIRAEQVKSTRAQASFTKLFSASRSTGQTNKSTLRAKSMQTFALEQHSDVYDALIADYNDDLEYLMTKQTEGRPLYMMVTLKTADGLRVFNDADENRATAVKGKLLVGELAQMGGAPPGVGTKLLGTVGAGFDKKKTRKEALQLVAADERGIAAEYCEISRTPKARFKFRPTKGAETASLRFKSQISNFSGEHLSFRDPHADSDAAEQEESDDEEYV